MKVIKQLFLVVVFIMLCQLLYAGEIEDFSVAKQKNTLESWENFINKYPKGENISAAEEAYDKLFYIKVVSIKHDVKILEGIFKNCKSIKCVNSLFRFLDTELGFLGHNLALSPEEKDQEKNNLELLMFAIAKKVNTIESYERYLKNFPKTRRYTEIRLLLDPLVFEQAAKENTYTAWQTYLKDFPDGAYIDKAKKQIALLDPFVYQQAAKEDYCSDYQLYIKKFPNGVYVNKAKQRIDWLRSQKTTAIIEFPKELESTRSPYSNVSSPFWGWKVVFRETGGKIGFKVQGEGYIMDSKGNKWGPSGMFIQKSEIKVLAGGVVSKEDWVSSEDHNFCNGYKFIIWSGEDAAGNPVRFEEKVYLKHAGCPGSESRK